MSAPAAERGERAGAVASAASAAGAAVSYYGRPVLKEPVWKVAIPLYFFSGGLAGGSAALAFSARLAGEDRLARNATLIGLAGIAVSPPLLIWDLGRPERFGAMLRMVKPTSPMSIGTWILSMTAASTTVAASCELLGILPRLKVAAEAAAAVLGLPLATYTAALIADTAVPVWHDARRELPFLFAGSAAAAAGAAAAMATPPADARAARRLALAGAMLEIAAGIVMERRLGSFVSEPYRHGPAGLLTTAARFSTAAGAALLGVAGKRRGGAAGGGGLLMAGSLIERLAIMRAGRESAADPKYTVVPQRLRAERTETFATTTRPPGWTEVAARR